MSRWAAIISHAFAAVMLAVGLARDETNTILAGIFLLLQSILLALLDRPS